MLQKESIHAPYSPFVNTSALILALSFCWLQGWMTYYCSSYFTLAKTAHPLSRCISTWTIEMQRQQCGADDRYCLVNSRHRLSWLRRTLRLPTGRPKAFTVHRPAQLLFQNNRLKSANPKRHMPFRKKPEELNTMCSGQRVSPIST